MHGQPHIRFTERSTALEHTESTIEHQDHESCRLPYDLQEPYLEDLRTASVRGKL